MSTIPRREQRGIQPQGNQEKPMTFWNLGALPLEEFRPGMMSTAEIGESLVMVCMQIAPRKEDNGHKHPFDQCGIG